MRGEGAARLGRGVGRLDLRPLVGEAEGGRLELQVGVLAAGHLVLVDLGGARLLARLEGGVREAHRLPVLDQLEELGQAHLRAGRGEGFG